MKKQVIHTTNAAVTGAPLRQAIRFGDLVFCSGASPRDPKQGNKVVEGGFQAQATQALENLKAGAGGFRLGPRALPEGDLLHSEHRRELPLLNEVWVKYFGDNIPARTAVGAYKLREDYLLEIEVTAYVP